ncbi:6833_t:CDS:2 [Cetraspora pellucida]|uniref:6833_t:CDS:1 n=1 Tax=Cetraspora pellucida TaxID=1433469 RepID=A0A9N9EVQ9_9GLOM|nr:6833_t:CDS:2 [Cetraspora pellucida]
MKSNNGMYKVNNHVFNLTLIDSLRPGNWMELLKKLAHKSNKRIIKRQFLEAERQILDDNKQSLEASIVQKHSDQNKYASKPIKMQEITKALSKSVLR